MTLLQSLAVASIILILGLKVYSMYRKPQRQTPVTSESNPTDQEVGDIQCVNSDHPVGENIVESRLDWGEIFLIIVGIGLCAPLGLILLWKTDNLDAKTKKVIIISYVGIVIMIALVKLGSP